ncbi:GTP pyrophosphokinase [Brachybacterium sp. DNPG3]
MDDDASPQQRFPHGALAQGAFVPPVRDLIAARAEQHALTDAEQDDLAAGLRQVYEEFTALRMHYQFAIDEMTTKVNILRREFEQVHEYSPIEHVRSRLKSVESLVEKALRTGGEMSVQAIRERILDIAGMRITCSFVSDAYWVADMLASQADLEVLKVKDYIAHPKPNGYRSLHLIVRVPVFLSDRTEHVPVELQIRTIAMDFWASTEHKLSYKYDRNLPPHLVGELDDVARLAHALDERMGRLREEIRPMTRTGNGLFSANAFTAPEGGCTDEAAPAEDAVPAEKAAPSDGAATADGRNH